MNKLLMEHSSFKQISAPVDLNAAAITGARVKLSAGSSCAVVLSFGDSTAAVVSIDFDQHNAASGGTSKALTVKGNYYYKADGETVFTKVEVRPNDTVTDTFDLASIFADAGGIVVFEFKSSHLDVENDFAWLSVNLADATAAKIFSGLYLIKDANFEPVHSVAL